MPEETIKTESQETPATPETTTPTEVDVTELQRQLDRMKAANAALAEEKSKLVSKIQEHGSEMKQKKERERKALEEAGEYQKALELVNQEKTELQKQTELFAAQQQEWDVQKKKYAVMFKLQQPGTINPTVPINDVLMHFDWSKVELDEAGQVVGWDDLYKTITTGRDYLRPTQTQHQGVPVPGAGTNGKPHARDAQAVAEATGVSVSKAQEMLQNPKTRDYYIKSGIIQQMDDVSTLFSGG